MSASYEYMPCSELDYPCCNSLLDPQTWAQAAHAFAPRVEFVGLTMWILVPALIMDSLGHITFGKATFTLANVIALLT